MAKKLTKSKAKEILHDKSVHGHPLTDKQRRFFGAIASAQNGLPIADNTRVKKVIVPSKLYKRNEGEIRPGEDFTSSDVTWKRILNSDVLAKERGDAAWDFMKKATALGQFAPHPIVRYPSIALNSMMGGVDAYNAYNKGDVTNAQINAIGAIPLPGYGTVKALRSTPGLNSRQKASVLRTAIGVLGTDLFGTAADLSDNFGVEKKQDGGWLDKFDTPQAQNGIEGTMGGLTDVGFNYNGAWGGTMQMGGVLPGAVGFTYARTAGAAPANGPYAKKTKASAQDGEKVAKEWLKNWYEERKTLPEFENIASKRIEALEKVPAVQLEPAPEMRKKSMLAAYIPAKKSIIAADPSTMMEGYDPELGVSPYVLGHEMIHALDYMAPQSGRDVPSYPKVDFVSEKASGLSRPEYSWITSGVFPGTKTEVNAVLYGLRQAEGLKGNKPTTPNQMKSIIDKYKNLGEKELNPRTKEGTRNIQIKNLLDVMGNDPEKLSELNNRIVKGKGKAATTAQNGQEMKYYQAGLDFKPKTISQDGSKTLPNVNLTPNQKEPVYVSDSNDPRLRAYQDSLTAYNVGRKVAQDIGRGYDKYYQENWNRSRNRNDYEKYFVKNYEAGKLKYPLGGNDRIFGSEAGRKLNEKDIKELAIHDKDFSKLLKLKVRPQSALYSAELPPIISYKKPTQPVVLEEEPRFEKPIPIPRDTRDLGYTLPTPKEPILPELYKYDPNTPTKFSFTYPTGKYNEQKTMYFPSKAALKSFVGGIRDATYQEGKDYASATGTLQDGGDIPVDPMGYWNPENVGSPVIIPSNVITMEGVDQPLLGISDTGDVQYMEPGEDYEFDGEYVTEYPVAQNGTATRADSLEVYNNAVAIRKYYDNLRKKGWYKKPEIEDLKGFSLNKDFYKEEMDRVKQQSLDTYRAILSKKDPDAFQFIAFKNVYPNASYNDFVKAVSKSLVQTKSGTNDRYYYKDLYPSIIDPMAPATLVNLKILPNQRIRFDQKGDPADIKYSPPGGAFTGLFSYDPLSVKPYDMRTPQEKIEWERKYGNKEKSKVKPTPPPVKKKVVTPTPEPVRQTTTSPAVTAPAVTAPSFTPPIVPSGSVGVFGPGRSRIGEYDEKTNTFYPDYGNLAARSKANEADADLISDEKELAAYVASKTGKKPKIDVTLAKQRNGGVNNADAQPLKKLDQLLNFTNYNKPTKGGWLDKYN